MSSLLKDLDETVVVMDDILVFGNDQEEHDQNLKAVMQTIRTSVLSSTKPSVSLGSQTSSILVTLSGKKASS